MRGEFAGQLLMRKLLHIVTSVLTIVVLQIAALADPPRVIAAVPDHGDAEIDPALNELRIEFDQDMSTDGMSWIGGGESYPQITGKPRWLNVRTCVMPVRLEPDHVYSLSINNLKYRNFRSPAGESAVPYLIMFRTKAVDSPVERLSEQQNRQAINELQQAIDSRYSYRDRLKLDWKALFQAHEKQLLESQHAFTFAVRTARMLAAAQDPHITAVAQSGRFPTHQHSVAANYNLGILSQWLQDFKQRSAAVLSGRFPDSVGYICIGTWDRRQESSIAKAFDALAELRDAPALIIDVRPNGGGDEVLAREFAGCFIEKPAVYSRHVFRDASQPGGFTAPQDRVVRPNAQHPHYQGKIIVLTGPVVMSSCESFVKMMQCAPQCKLVGARTAGSSGNPKPIELPNGVTVLLPSWKDLLPDGSELEGVGIAPDIEVNVPADGFRNGDPVVERALELLKEAQPAQKSGRDSGR